MTIRKILSCLPPFLLIFSVLVLNACGGGGGSGNGTNQTNDTNPSGLAAPTNVTAFAGDGEVTVSWSAVTGADSYNIYINDASFASKSSYITKDSSSTSPLTVSGLQNGDLHTVVVTATDTTSESDTSSSAQFTPTGTPPATVTGLSAVAGNKQVALSWTAVNNATTYTITYATDDLFTTGTGNLTTSSTGYTFTDLSNGTTYYYKVRAENSAGQSDYSAVVNATPDLESGWNIEDEIARHGDSGFTEIYSRNDAMNANRDALVAWSFGNASFSYVYANTYSKSTDWGTKVEISSSGIQSASALSANGDGIVAWAEKTYLDPDQLTWRYDIFVKHYQSGTWGSAIQMSGSESGDYPSEPSVELDSNGNAVVAWHADDGNFYAKTYDKATDTWSATVTQVNSIGNQYATDVKIHVDDNDLFVLAWGEDTTANNYGLDRVYVRNYSKAAGWESAVQVNTDDPLLEATNSLYSFDVNGNGEIFVLWKHSTSSTDNQLLLRIYSPSIPSWSSTITVDTANFALDDATIKSDNAGNAVLHWKKRIDDGNDIIESNNFAVYDTATDSVGPIEEMLVADYDFSTVDIVSDADYSFHMFYGLNGGPTHAYQRTYDFNAQTWSAPVTIIDYFGRNDYIATSNTAGEILLIGQQQEVNYLNGDSWELINATFYLP
jgi:hypothetical protein